MAINQMGGSPNQWPFESDVTDAEVEMIHENLRRAEQFAHPTSQSTMADRIMGEVALRYRLPQNMRDLLWERERMQRNLRDVESFLQAQVVPQGTPPQTPGQPQARNKLYRSGDTTERTAYRKAADRPAIKKGR